MHTGIAVNHTISLMDTNLIRHLPLVKFQLINLWGPVSSITDAHAIRQRGFYHVYRSSDGVLGGNNVFFGIPPISGTPAGWNVAGNVRLRMLFVEMDQVCQIGCLYCKLWQYFRLVQCRISRVVALRQCSYLGPFYFSLTS